MGKLSDILNGSGSDFNDTWNATAAAGEFGPVPLGVYVCHATKGELKNVGRKETEDFQLEFTIIDGDFQGRKLWLDRWLTPAALPQSKRDLAKLGITSPDQMEQPLPKLICCNVTAVVRRDDDGIDRNKVQTFEVVGIDKPEADAFAPKPPGEAADPKGEADTSFDPSKL